MAGRTVTHRQDRRDGGTFPAGETLPPELSLLVTCARPRVCPPVDEQRLQEPTSSELDWDLFVDLAQRHGMFPIVGRLAEGWSDVPEVVSGRLRELRKANTLHSLRLSGTLVRILQGLEKAGVGAMPIKGPVLAQEAYGDLTLRHSMDLDLLLLPEQMSAAVSLLLDHGYEPLFPIDLVHSDGVLLERPWEDQGRRLAEARQHVNLRSVSRGFVELHWRLVRERDDLRLPTARVLARARTVRFLESDVPFFRWDDLFLYQVVHASTHGWDQLEHLHCLAEIVSRQPEIGWADVRDLACEAGVSRRMNVAVVLLSEMLGVGWDPWVLEEAWRDTAAVRVAAAAVAGWQTQALRAAGERTGVGVPPGRLRPTFDRIAGLDDTRARLRYAASIVFEPDETDRSAVRLPPRLDPLYHLLRPGRLSVVYAKRAGAGAARAVRAKAKLW